MRGIEQVLRALDEDGERIGVEDAGLVGDSRSLVVALQSAQHVQYAMQCTRRLVLRRPQVGQGMEGAVEVR